MEPSTGTSSRSTEKNMPQVSRKVSFSADSDVDRTSSMIFLIVTFVTLTFGVLCVALMAVWTADHLGGFSWSNANLQFNYHPLFMVIGLIFLYGEAILIYRTAHGLSYFVPSTTRWMRKPVLKIIHAVLHGGALIFTIVSLIAVFDFHNKLKYANMYSLHSWIGLATVILFCLQYVLGLAFFLFPKTPAIWRARILPLHTFFGLGIFILSIATALMGMTEKLFWTNDYNTSKFPPTAVIGNCFGLFVVVFGFLVVFLATTSRFKRRPLPGEETANNYNVQNSLN